MGPIRFMCATHPHFDHISGLRKVLVRFKGSVAEFWDSGFRYTSATYRALLDEVVKQAPLLRLIRSTSGAPSRTPPSGLHCRPGFV